jgi:T5SS/PEP-CTERM-associated repeat protein
VVTGSSSTWQVAGALDVGDAGAGSLGMTAGGTVAASSLDAGVLAGASGVVSLSGTATSLSVAGTVGIGDAGQGELSVLNGATVSVGGNLDIGNAAGGSGNVDIENATLAVGGALNLGAAGPGVLTVGAGAHVSIAGGLVGGADAALVQFAAIDPDFDDGVATTVSFSGEQDYPAYVDGGASFAIDQGYSFALDTPLIDGGAQFAIGQSAADTQATTLVLNAGSADASTGITFKSKLGTLVIGTDALATIDTQASDAAGVTLTANPDLGAPLIGAFYATIYGFKTGDSIIVDTAQAATFSRSANVVSVNAGGVVLGSVTFATAALATAAMNGGLVDQVVPCFAAGTRIRTDRGDVAVEALREGDRAWSVLGSCYAPVAWVGRRTVDCARHPRPRAVWPVRVAAGALGPGAPARDVWLSPDHAVYADGVLVPVRYLVNGTTVRQEPRDSVTYCHVELDRHDVLLADGLPAESYLDTGTRSNFANGGGAVALHPDFSRAGDVWEMAGCAPLVVTGAALQAVRDRIAEWARAAA